MSKSETISIAQRLLKDGHMSAIEISDKTGLNVLEIIFMRCQLSLFGTENGSI